jgi:hypothetical protein
MKRTITIICFLLFLVNSFAQNNLQTGITIGYNSSTFIGSDKSGLELSSIPGFYLGGIVNYPINSRFSLLANVALASRGTEINTISDITEDVIFFYLDVPLILKMNLLTGKIITPYIVLGGAFDYNILAGSTGGGNLNDVKNIDLGIVSGLGIDIWKLSFGIRYNYGLIPFDNSDLKLNLRNSTLSFLVGIKFNK